MLKGTLDDFTLPDIFRLMSLAKKTGRMDVSRGAGQGRVFFNEGDVYYAESSLSREPLGQKLIRARALTESQLNKALDTHAQTGKRVGDIMIESGMVTSDQIEAAVAQQIEDAVFDLLRWDLGEFTWEAGAELEVEVPISVSVENLIMEASRRLDELEVIQRKIPGEHAVLMMASTPPEGAAEINITPEEWRALVLVDGSRTLGEIGRLIGKDDFETMRILYGLVSAGLVEVDHDASAAAAEAAQLEVEVEDAGAEVEVEIEAEAEIEAPAAETFEPETFEGPAEIEDGAAPEPALELLEPEPEAEVVAAAPALGSELADLVADAPGGEVLDEAAPEAEAFEIPGPEEVAAPDAEAEEAEAELVETGVSADQVVDEGELDMTVDELLDAASAVDEAPVLEQPPAPPGEAVADLEDESEAAEPVGEDLPAEPPTAETVSVGDAEDPFLSDLLDQDVAAEAPEGSTAPTEEPVAEEEVAEPEAPEAEPEGSPTVDRAAVVRELAGLFDEERPKSRPSGPGAPPAPGAPAEDQRKRVEDDEQINKSVISRLIKGVKGL